LAKTPWAPGAPVLAAAARVVEEVASGRSADAALAAADQGPDRAAVRAIALGTVRWYLRLTPAIEALLERPAALSAPLRALLAVAAHQVEYSRNAPEMSVHAAVDAARLLKAERATGLVNAVLRRFVGERAALFDRIDEQLPAHTAHPSWLIDALQAAWPKHWAAILDANNRHPPLTLRVDLTRTDRASYLGQLKSAGIDALEIQWLNSAVTLTRPLPVTRIPGFAEGLVSVQDAGAQLAAPLLAVSPGMRVLDACAAPGGKTAHLLELLGPEGDLTAVDIDAGRAALIEENLARTGRRARVVAADLREPERFWDGRPFERILIDAPCSSTGVIRRHPDIKLLRRPSDVAAFALTQKEILAAAARLLAPGGRLLYSTCSLLPAENGDVVSAFLTGEGGFRLAQMPAAGVLAPGALDLSPGVQLLPGAEAGTDGFYYACLEKTTAGT
jgi:16S rRNA (cytosine967-C5)-methyltransferase